ncbi:MAG: hypothetical protein LBK99_07330 [Opitutaceae bacterium]|jgi:hypothetical protein|nr:hypothetical protein [Opitutaceae bacterium]
MMDKTTTELSGTGFQPVDGAKRRLYASSPPSRHYSPPSRYSTPGAGDWQKKPVSRLCLLHVQFLRCAP